MVKRQEAASLGIIIIISHLSAVLSTSFHSHTVDVHILFGAEQKNNTEYTIRLEQLPNCVVSSNDNHV
jgi:hypothetical protein